MNGTGLMEFGFEGKPVRVVMINGEPWWVAKDVCEVLGIANHRDAVGRLPESMKDDVGIPDAIGRLQQTTVINEPGVYKLTFRSNKAEAERFTDWLATDVLPSIRKTGGYQLAPAPSHRIPQSFAEALRLAADLQEQIEAQKPLVTFAETCLTSKDSILVRELAKVAKDQHLDIGEKRLYQKLRDWGLVLKGKTEPTQRGMEMGLFEVIERPKDTPYGTRLFTTTKVTPKGQVYIIEKLRSEQNGAS